MYYYKKVNEANEVEYIESCVHEKARPSLNMAEISGGEYERLLSEMYKEPEKPGEEISSAEALKIIVGGVSE